MYNPYGFGYPYYRMFNNPSLYGMNNGIGFFRKLGLGNGLFRNINWGNLFNNTSRALNVVNQTIPIVKQVGPMFNNMRSMLRVASAFKDVTDGDKKNVKQTLNTFNNNINNDSTNLEHSQHNNYNYVPYNINYGNPNFFI